MPPPGHQNAEAPLLMCGGASSSVAAISIVAFFLCTLVLGHFLFIPSAQPLEILLGPTFPIIPLLRRRLLRLHQRRLRRRIVWIILQSQGIRGNRLVVVARQKVTQAQPSVGLAVRGLNLQGRQGIAFGQVVLFQITIGGGAVGIVNM